MTAPIGPPERRWVQTHGRQWRYEVQWHFHADWRPTAPRVLTATLRLDSADLVSITQLRQPRPAA